MSTQYFAILSYCLHDINYFSIKAIFFSIGQHFRYYKLVSYNILKIISQYLATHMIRSCITLFSTRQFAILSYCPHDINYFSIKVTFVIVSGLLGIIRIKVILVIVSCFFRNNWNHQRSFIPLHHILKSNGKSRSINITIILNLLPDYGLITSTTKSLLLFMILIICQ